MSDELAHIEKLYKDMIEGLRLGSSCLSILADDKYGHYRRQLLYLPDRPANATATWAELRDYRIYSDLCFAQIDVENGVVTKKIRSLKDDGIITILSKQLDNYLSGFPEKDRNRFQNNDGEYTPSLLGAINGIGHKVINTHKAWTKNDHSPDTMLMMLTSDDRKGTSKET